MSEFFRKIHLNGQEVTVPTDSYGTPLITLDEEYFNKRKNRIIMEKAKQKRDSRGRFASAEEGQAAPMKKGTKLATKKVHGKAFAEPAIVNWQKEYDKKVRETLELQKELENTQAELAGCREHNSELTKRVSEIRERLEDAKNKYRFWERKATKYLDTISLLNSLVSELDGQNSWFLNSLSWIHKAYFFKKLRGFIERATSLHEHVRSSMRDWN